MTLTGVIELATVGMVAVTATGACSSLVYLFVTWCEFRAVGLKGLVEREEERVRERLDEDDI